MRLLLFSLLLSFVLTNCPTEGDTNIVDMRASINPPEAGVVNPPKGTYAAGRQISVTTEALGERWQFTGWSGDTTASEDSISFRINRDMNLVANYEIPPELRAFSDSVIVSDGKNSKKVTFGMQTNATSGYDSNLDEELPPRPPEGNFYRRFNIPDYGLKTDYRGITEGETIWVLEVAPDAGRTITLSWNFTETNYAGSLTLTDDLENPSIEIDMKTQTTYSATTSGVSTFYIIGQN